MPSVHSRVDPQKRGTSLHPRPWGLWIVVFLGALAVSSLVGYGQDETTDTAPPPVAEQPRAAGDGESEVVAEAAPPPKRGQHIFVLLPDGQIGEYRPGLSPDRPYQLVGIDDGERFKQTFEPWYQRMFPQNTREWLLLFFGLMGQFLFTGRWLVQWFASERAKQSVIPIGYWWLSMGGAAVLLTYFIIRGEPIGILGQMFGFTVYGRNLMLIARTHHTGGDVTTELPPNEPAAHPIPDPNAEA